MNYDSAELATYFKEINFIGPFPGGIEVLLVPMEPAYAEAKLLYPDLKQKMFVSLLTKERIFIFNTLDDWLFYQGKGNLTRKHRARKP